jgi:hypothetical protein
MGLMPPQDDVDRNEAGRGSKPPTMVGRPDDDSGFDSSRPRKRETCISPPCQQECKAGKTILPNKPSTQHLAKAFSREPSGEFTDLRDSRTLSKFT